MSSKQILLALGVVAAGIGAAWPFRRDLQPRAPAAAIETNVTELTLRQQDVTLKASPVGELSPATGLDEFSSEGEAGQPQDRLASARVPLESLGLPPEMPPVFRSLILPAARGSYPAQRDAFEPRAAISRPGYPTPLASPLPPRAITHRIVDGDTLEKLAEQYLGDASRAREIFEANRAVLDDPQLLPLGKVIELPREQQQGLEPVPPAARRNQAPDVGLNR